jgi:hypothetical protein
MLIRFRDVLDTLATVLAMPAVLLYLGFGNLSAALKQPRRPVPRWLGLANWVIICGIAAWMLAMVLFNIDRGDLIFQARVYLPNGLMAIPWVYFHTWLQSIAWQAGSAGVILAGLALSNEIIIFRMVH